MAKSTRKILLLLLLFIPAVGFGQPESLKHNNTYYVDDYANVFTQDQVRDLDQIIRKFFDTAQISIVTIKSFGGISYSDYATRLGRKWGVGGASNNGLLIIIGIKDRHIEVATGYGLEGDLPDVTVVSLQRKHAVPNFKAGKYYEGTKELLLAYINELSPSAKVLREKENAAQAIRDEAMKEKMKNVAFAFLILCGMGGLIYLPIYKRNRKRRLEQEKIDEEKRVKLWDEEAKRSRELAISALAMGALSSQIPKPKKEEKKSYSSDSDYSYTPPSYNSDNSSSDNSNSSSSSSDFGGGSFGGGGGGSDW